MAGVQETLAAAVVAHIDAATYSQSFTPEKKLVPTFERDQLDGYAVSVYCGPAVREKQSRSGVYLKTWSVGIVIRCAADLSAAQLETKAGDFLQLCEEIADSLEDVNMAGLPPVEIDQEAPFDMGKVSDHGMLFAQITIKYKGF